MARQADYDQWVLDWISSEKQKGRKCFDVKKVVNAYYVYYQTTRYNPDKRKREKVSAYIGKLVKGVGLVEPHGQVSREEVYEPRYGLGVDTGGTFTDAVIVDLDDFSVIAKAKSLTTHHDLSIGLYNSVDSVFASCDVDPSEIRLIGISTTLATNSVLEGHGGDVGLIFIGWEPDDGQNFGAKNVAYVKGGFDSKGKPVSQMNLEEVTNAIRSVSDGVDALVISGLFSIVNSSQEEKVKDLAIKLTGLPTVAGHELSSTLGIDVRAETAVLNGKLIPVIRRFFEDVECTFRNKGLTAPIMVYKGDGSVMTMERARTYPVETVFSGPAASSMGGKITSGYNDFIMVDIGGTSTDVALVEGGMPQIECEGALVGGWRTRVKAVDMLTIALGGDSRISIEDSKVIIGPDRVVPLSQFTSSYPHIIDEILHTDVYDYYVLNDVPDGISLTERERIVVNAMVDRGPMSSIDIIEAAEGLWVIDEEIRELTRKGVVTASSFTPSDLLVYLGMFENGNRNGPSAGVHAISQRLGTDESNVSGILMEEIRRRIAEAVLTRLIDDRMRNWKSPETAMFLREMASLKEPSGFTMLPRVDIPIIGIGAPTRYLMDDIGTRLGTKVIFPQDGDVGNAIGAVSSKMVESLTAVVTPTKDFRYKSDVPFIGPTYHTRLEGAISSAQNSLRSFLESKLKSEHAKNINVTYKIKKFLATEGGIGNGNNDTGKNVNRIEVIARAIGDPPEMME